MQHIKLTDFGTPQQLFLSAMGMISGVYGASIVAKEPVSTIVTWTTFVGGGAAYYFLELQPNLSDWRNAVLALLRIVLPPVVGVWWHGRIDLVIAWLWCIGFATFFLIDYYKRVE